MSLITANNVAVLGGSIMMPLNGVWTADLQIDQPDGSGFDAGIAVTIKSADGFEIKGTVAPERAGSFLDSMHVRVVGGKGGTAKTVQARGYVQPGAFVRDVLNGLTQDAGESLSSKVDTSFLQKNLTAWSVVEAKLALALNTFLSFLAPDFNWRFLEDGTLWLGAEAWPTSAVEFEVLERDPMQGTADLGVATLAIVPGALLEDVGKVYRVEHLIAPTALRSVVWTVADVDDVRAGVAKIVAQEMAHVDYFALYECKVVAQSVDLTTVDVQPLSPVDEKIPGLQRVEVRAGTGIKVQFTQGAKVLLGWKGGDPALPYVLPGLSSDTFEVLKLGGDGAASFVALANLVKARLDTIQSSYDGHKHQLSSGAMTSVPDVLIAELADVAAQKVKAH